MTGNASGRIAFLVLTNKLTPELEQRIEAATSDLAGRCEVHVIGYFEEAASVPARFRTDPRFQAYDMALMDGMGYPFKGRPYRMLPGNTDMPVLAFARDHPQYDAIWLFEDDAIFTGPLSELVDAFSSSSSDLITTNISSPPEGWPWLVMNRFPEGWPDDVPKLRALVAVYRVSRALLSEIDRFYREGGNGHYEFIWPYVAQATGLQIEDIGGRGDYVRPGNRNRFYTSSPEMLYLFPGSFRFRPTMERPGRRRSFLWHPVKRQEESSIAKTRWKLQLYSRWLRRHLLPGYRE